MKEALEQSIELINASKYENVVATMRSAIAVGTLPSVGHKFFDEVDARMAPMTRNVVATGIPELDAKDIMQGGLGRGELGVIVAPTGVGKSHGLVCLGANAIRQGKTVVHYTFELSEQYTGIRYDSNFTKIESNNVLDSKEKVKVMYKDQKEWGKLYIKEYPSNSCSVLTMRNHLEKLEITEGVRPDMILVDYADIMRSTRNFDAIRHELKLVYEELRGLGQELAVPVWTASQANRDASKAEIVGLENMSEAYAKAMVADFVMSFSRKPLEKSKGIGRLFIAKNRMGRDGLVYPIKIDTARSIIEVSADAATLEEEAANDRDIMKEAVRTDWEKVKADRELNAQKVG
jgi:replicative DNA helicase